MRKIDCALFPLPPGWPGNDPGLAERCIGPEGFPCDRSAVCCRGSVATGMSSRMTVLSFPAPSIVMPFVRTTVEVQLAVPVGSTTVSPSEAEAIAESTSATEVLLALIMLAAKEASLKVLKNMTNATMTRPSQNRPEELRSRVLFVDINELPRFFGVDGRAIFFNRFEVNPSVIDSNDVKHEPNQTKALESCFSPVVSYYGN